MRKLVALLLFLAVVASAAGLKFEVASIKASPPGGELRAAGMPPRLGTTISGNRVDFELTSLEVLIRTAYKLESYQISGPDWLPRTSYTVVATMPPGAKREQIPEMLRSLLEDRFGLSAHRESREQNVYTLLVGPEGANLKDAAPSVGPMDKPFPKGNGGRALLRAIRTEYGGFWTISSFKGETLFEAAKITMPQLALFLMDYGDAPTLDQTGLKGAYEISLVVPPRPARVQFLGMRGGGFDDASEPSGVSIFQTVRTLGLTLERRKTLVERLVVDRVEKTPTEN